MKRNLDSFMQNVMCLNYSKVVSSNVKGRPFEFLLAGSGRFRPLTSVGIPPAIPAK